MRPLRNLYESKQFLRDIRLLTALLQQKIDGKTSEIATRQEHFCSPKKNFEYTKPFPYLQIKILITFQHNLFIDSLIGYSDL